MKNIIVTGGCGYIGSHTVVELIESGYTVHILDNLSNSDVTVLDRIEQITGTRPPFTRLDLRDERQLLDFFKTSNQIEGIIHFAALKSVNESIEKPLSYYDNNIGGLLNLLKAVQELDPLNFVFSSSCTVYGAPEKLPVTELSPMGFTPSTYGATKQMAERILDDFTHANPAMRGISLRYFNPLGAHESHLIGELPSGIPNNLLPYITQTAAGIRDFLYVYGDDYQTPDGTAIRDYIHVTDIAKAHVKALEFIQNQKEALHEKVNVGTGKGYSVLDVIRSFERTSGIKLPYKITHRRPGDVECIYADPQKAKEILDWESTLSLDDMTRSAWKWEQFYRESLA